MKIYINPKFSEVTGYSFEEVVGKNPRILKSGATSHEEYRILWENITNGRNWSVVTKEYNSGTRSVER